MPKVSLPPDAGTFPGLEHQGPEGRPVVAQILPQSQQAVPHADHAMGTLVIVGGGRCQPYTPKGLA